jgi:hypothetical protein
MQDLGNEVALRLSTADGGDYDVTAVLDEAGQAWLKSAMAGKAALEVQLRPSEDDDVRAHAADGGVVVVVTIGGGEDDDVEGHAMSLHFPSMEAARDFERRLLATGLIAGTVAVSIVGVGINSQTHTGIGSAIAPIAGDAPTVQYAPTARDTDRGDLSAPVFTIQTGSGEHIGLSEAAAAGAAATTTPQYAPAVRDTDRVDAGTTIAGGKVVNDSAAPSTATRANDTVGGYTTAAAAAASAAAGTQYAPAIRDVDRVDAGTTIAGGKVVNDSAAPSAANRANDTVGGYTTAAAAAASAAGGAQYAPAVRDNYRVDAGTTVAGGKVVNDSAAPSTAPRSGDHLGGYMTAAAAASLAQTDPRANDTVGGYMTAAGAAAASGSATEEHVGLSEMATGAGAAVDPRAGDTVGGYMTAAGAAAASGAATDEHVGLSELATGAGAQAAPQYAPTVRDTDRGDLGTPAPKDDAPQSRGPGPK